MADPFPVPALSTVITPPRAKISLARNSRGTTYSVEYSHEDPQTALETTLQIFDQLGALYPAPEPADPE